MSFATTSTVTANPADLQVTAVITEPENFSGEKNTVTWTVVNQGNDVWAGTKSWLDAVYFSPDPEFIPSRATLLTTLEHANDQGLVSGASYTVSAVVTLPAGTDGKYYIYVITDAMKPSS